MTGRGKRAREEGASMRKPAPITRQEIDRSPGLLEKRRKTSCLCRGGGGVESSLLDTLGKLVVAQGDVCNPAGKRAHGVVGFRRLEHHGEGGVRQLP